MKDFVREATVTMVWDYTRPFLMKMASEIAADLAGRLRELAR